MKPRPHVEEGEFAVALRNKSCEEIKEVDDDNIPSEEIPELIKVRSRVVPITPGANLVSKKVLETFTKNVKKSNNNFDYLSNNLNNENEDLKEHNAVVKTPLLSHINQSRFTDGIKPVSSYRYQASIIKDGLKTQTTTYISQNLLNVIK